MTSIFKRNKISDKDKLLSLMNSAIRGDFVLCNENEFTDRELARLYNNFLEGFFKSCNETALELNDSMRTIGNCNNVRTMLEIVDRQKNNLSICADMGGDISESIQNCEEILNTINNDTASAYETSVHSKEDILNTFSNVNQSHSAVGEAADAMKKFSEKSEAIKDILNLVSDIAAQTQILALNAKIEASRSADGKGFAVVADEISRLSVDTRKTVERVNMFIYEILSDVQFLVGQLDDLKIMLEHGKDSTYKTEQSVQKMADNMQNVIGEVSKLFNHINEQNNLTKSFTENMITIAQDSDILENYCRNPGKDMYVISRSVDKIRTKYVKGRSNLSKKELLDIFDVDHLIFTGRLYNMIEDFEKLELQNLNQPKNCKFGKWLENLKKEEPALSRNFDVAEQFHIQLHNAAVSCFKANEAGEKERALEFFEVAQKEYKAFSAELNRLKSKI